MVVIVVRYHARQRINQNHNAIQGNGQLYAVRDDCETEVSWLGELLLDETDETSQGGIIYHMWMMLSVG